MLFDEDGGADGLWIAVDVGVGVGVVVGASAGAVSIDRDGDGDALGCGYAPPNQNGSIGSGRRPFLNERGTMSLASRPRHGSRRHLPTRLTAELHVPCVWRGVLPGSNMGS